MPPCGKEIHMQIYRNFFRFGRAFYRVVSYETVCKYKETMPYGAPIPAGAWSAAARLLGLRVRIPPGAWNSICCVCCVLSGRGLCDGLITRPEESYRVWCV